MAAIVQTLEVRTLLSAAPVIANVGPTFAYTEGAPPMIVAGKATVTDGDNAFALAKLTVKTTNGGAGDKLGILNGDGIGMGPNGAILFAASPTASPVQIGTVTGGEGNVPLAVSFNGSATQTSVQAVLDHVGYGNGTSTLAIPDRSISFQFTDGKGGASAIVTKTIHINPAPVISNLGAPLNYVEGAPPMLLAPAAKISDAPNAYSGSNLTVKIDNGQTGDQLGILNGGGVGMGPNGAVLYSPSTTVTPVVIGTVTGGAGTTPLVVTFNDKATQAGVQAVLDHVAFGNGLSTLQTPDRHVTLLFADGNKVSTVPMATGIHVNPAPVIGSLGDVPVNYAVNASPVVLAPTAVLADAAGAYANSKLSVKLSGGDASDQLAIQAKGALTLGANNTLLFNNVIVGTFAGGKGADPLAVAFNTKATHDAVQAVLENITFSYKTTSATPVLANRLATFGFIDGNNIAAAPKVKGIHVTAK